MRLVSVHFVSIFLLTRLMRGATTKYHKLAVAPVISTHAPHARRDYIPDHFGRTRRDFYSRASCERDWHHPQIESIHFQFLLPRLLRGATKKRSFVSHTFRISTPTPLARRDAWQYSTSQNPKISTHAPLARRDEFFHRQGIPDAISTHAPLARRDSV